MTQMQCAWHRGAQRCKGCRAAGKQQPDESTLHPLIVDGSSFLHSPAAILEFKKLQVLFMWRTTQVRAKHPRADCSRAPQRRSGMLTRRPGPRSPATSPARGRACGARASRLATRAERDDRVGGAQVCRCLVASLVLVLVQVPAALGFSGGRAEGSELAGACAGAPRRLSLIHI